MRVGRVKPCGPSEEAGLLKGDYINRINGQNVSMASAQSVAEIVRLVDVTTKSVISTSLIRSVNANVNNTYRGRCVEHWGGFQAAGGSSVDWFVKGRYTGL